MVINPGTLKRYCPILLAFLGVAGIAPLGRASLLMNIQPVSDAAGTTGDTLDVTLTNTGPSSVTIAGFTFGIGVGTSNLTFTGVTDGTTTATYIFSGNSLFGPDISQQPPNLPGQTLEASDLWASIGTGATVGTGATAGLGHVTFNLAAATPSGPISVNFIPADDSLSDAAGAALAFTANNGTVTVTRGGTSTPEPGTFAFAAVALVALGWGRRFRRAG